MIEIKRQLYKRYLIITKELFERAEPNFKSPAIGEKRKGYLISALIFLALSIESFINEFGYENVEAYDDIEKIDTIQKIIILPQICKMPNPVIKKSDIEYANLKELFQYRNLFVHQKPKFRNRMSSQEQGYDSVDFDLLRKHYKNIVKIMKLFQIKHKINVESEDWITIQSESIG